MPARFSSPPDLPTFHFSRPDFSTIEAPLVPSGAIDRAPEMLESVVEAEVETDEWQSDSEMAEVIEGKAAPERTQTRRARIAALGRTVANGLVLLGVVGALTYWSLPSHVKGNFSTRWQSLWHHTKGILPIASIAAGGDYDVVVVGGTPAGIAAALAAARRGSKVLLVEERPQLGGDIVYAMLNMFDVVARPGETSPVHGIFAEFFEQLGVSCDINRAQKLFAQSTAIEPNLKVETRTTVAHLLKDGDHVTGLVLRDSIFTASHPIEAPRSIALPSLASSPAQMTPKRGAITPLNRHEREVHARVFVDATNDADIAARAGAGYYIGRENANPDKRMQAAGLLFSVSGVNWEMVRDYVRGRRLARVSSARILQNSIDAAPVDRATRRLVRRLDNLDVGRSADQEPVLPLGAPMWLRLGGAHGNYAWERGDIIKNYRPRGADLQFLSINFGRQDIDGSVVLNTLNIIGVDGLNPQSKQRARQQAAREIPFFIAYLRHQMPGFRHARLKRIAPELYVRETRHIHGFYALKVEDVRRETRFADRVAMVAYPLDLHPYKKGDINPFGPRRYYYTLPLRCLVPRKVDNLFVASRSLSATYSAAGSARVIPVSMAAGEAAGAAAHLCVRENLSPHQLMSNTTQIAHLQADLRKWGADIGDTYPTSRVTQLRHRHRHPFVFGHASL